MASDDVLDALRRKLHGAHRTVQLQAFRALLIAATSAGAESPALQLLRQLIVDPSAPALPRAAAFHALPTLVQRGVYSWADAQEDLVRAASVAHFGDEQNDEDASKAGNTSEAHASSKRAGGLVDVECILDAQLSLARLVAGREPTTAPRDAKDATFQLPYAARKHPLVLLLDRSSNLIALILDAIETTVAEMQAEASKNAVKSRHLGRFLRCVRAPLLHALTTVEDASARMQTCAALVRIARRSAQAPAAAAEARTLLIDGWQTAMTTAAGDLSVVSMGEAVLDLLAGQSDSNAAADVTHAVTRTALLCWSALLDSVAADQPVRPWLSMLERLHLGATTVGDDGYVALALACCAWLLFTAATPRDLLCIIRILRTTLQRAAASTLAVQRLAALAALPLLQLLSDAGDAQLRTLAAETFSTIEASLHSVVEHNADASVALGQQFEDMLGTACLTGQLAMVAHFTRCFVDATAMQTHRGSQATSLEVLFFDAPFIFAASADYRHPLLVFPELAYLPVYLYLLRTSSDSMRATILLRTLPGLATDASGTAAVVKLATGMIAHREGGRLAATGVRTLLAAWRHNPRVWRVLRSVCADWIQKHPRVAAGGSHRSVDMELAVVFTLRDVVQERAKECGEDVLSLVATLLQTCCLTPMALSAALDAICSCVHADIVDARTVWTVLISHVASVAKQRSPPNARVMRTLCRFFALAGKIREDTEGNVEFKRTVLADYLWPLAFPTADTHAVQDDTVRAAALDALAQFSTADLAVVMPETSRQLLSLIIDDPQPAHARLLTTLMRDEVHVMRRGLFKGASSALATSKHQRASAAAREQLEQYLAKLHESWSMGEISPSLCSAGALAAMHHTEEMIDASLAARLVCDLARDANFSEGLLWRLGAVPSWITFFRRILGDDNATRAGQVANACYQGICDQLAASRIPAEIGNLRRPHIAAGDYANFATVTALAQLTSLLSMDDVLVRDVFAILRQGMEVAG
ncbi:hypothetical protein THASP1DRAFT_32151 [Thamnocephalis sphaerospora]|uniref:DUF3730 domain-containing protein n=1 Tax=Thamnocephalis sphaerospora TaxID=78915 RepID=A0A4P9XJS4_9FUNG|nr:hypothetical protein THASP1DRAFT_32151 [Thamnocephalis sphaerospora]|eukprot:RKP06024.1 hypothetical protein THASP1DRAFT_32151 [Thamnocephalis sphaerospora]